MYLLVALKGETGYFSLKEFTIFCDDIEITENDDVESLFSGMGLKGVSLSNGKFFEREKIAWISIKRGRKIKNIYDVTEE